MVAKINYWEERARLELELEEANKRLEYLHKLKEFFEKPLFIIRHDKEKVNNILKNLELNPYYQCICYRFRQVKYETYELRKNLGTMTLPDEEFRVMLYSTTECWMIHEKMMMKYYKE